MIRKAFFALMAVLVVAASTQAGVVVSTSAGAAVPGLAGYKSYTLTATSDGMALQGFDFTGDPTAPIDANSRGFFGAMSQLNPAGFATVFNDNNALIPALSPGHTAAEDSQFLFKSSDLLVIPGSATESATSLRGAFSTTTNFGQSVAFAQLVIPDGQAGAINYIGVAGTTDGAEFALSGCVGVCGGGDIQPVVNDLALNNAIIGATVNGTVTGTDVLAWSPTLTYGGYVPQLPALPGAPDQHMDAVWNPANQLFTWNTTGARPGVYTWTVSGANGALSDGGTITVTQTVPEPATLSLFGLALVGFFGIARKRS